MSGRGIFGEFISAARLTCVVRWVGASQVDDLLKKIEDEPSEPGIASASVMARFRETETIKNELLDQLEQLGHLAERLESAYQHHFPGPDETSLDVELRAAVKSSPVITQELVQFAREVLHDYDASRSSAELLQLQQHARHDIRNMLTPVYGLSQEVEITALPDSPLAIAAAELRNACEAATRLLDFLTGKTGTELSPGVEDDQLLTGLVTANDVEPSRILVADDNITIAHQLRRHLERLGHSVVVVHDGQAAIAQLDQRRDFDLVLLDVIMPGLDGVQVLSWIKNHSELRHVPVIMVSGLADDKRTVDCIAAGAEDYLSKPINTVLLDARVRSCLRRRQAEKHRLQQYFSRELAQELACNNGDLLRTRDADVSILFCDIRRFSSISERVGAATTIEWIGSTMGTLARVVFEEQGVLIDYIGDGLMAMWGAPKPLDNHADLAVRAGLSMLNALGKLNAEWAPRLNEQVRLGVGINSGSAHVGVIGSSPKFKYGPLGSTVNLASRVEGTTKHLQCSLIVTQHTRKLLLGKTGYSIRRLCRAGVVNMKRPVSLYEVQLFDEQLRPVFRTYQTALRLYENREFRDAARVLGKLLSTYEEMADVPSQLLMSRVLSAMADQSSFNPVWKFGK